MTGPQSPFLGEGIALDPDRNIWFTEGPLAFDRIGVKDFGSLETTEFLIRSTAWGITAGPDGNVWFTEPGAQLVAQTTPAGTITEFPIP